MKESHRKGLAIHPEPESCDVRRRADVEALTGAHAGWVLSSEIRLVRGADVVRPAEGNTEGSSSRDPGRPSGVEDPIDVWKLHVREPRGPIHARSPTGAGRLEKGHEP